MFRDRIMQRENELVGGTYIQSLMRSTVSLSLSPRPNRMMMIMPAVVVVIVVNFMPHNGRISVDTSFYCAAVSAIVFGVPNRGKII